MDLISTETVQTNTFISKIIKYAIEKRKKTLWSSAEEFCAILYTLVVLVIHFNELCFSLSVFFFFYRADVDDCHAVAAQVSAEAAHRGGDGGRGGGHQQ